MSALLHAHLIRTLRLLLVIGAILLAVPLTPAHAQFAVEVQEQPAPELAFGEALTFRITATSATPITEATLVVRATSIYWGKAQFVPGPTINAEYRLDVEQWPLEAFASLDYWWEFADAAGNTATTLPQSVQYIDNRQSWESLSDGRLTVYWQSGDARFGQTALQTATAGLLRANQLLQTTLPETIAVYVYPSQSAARAAFSATDPLWTDAKAYPQSNTVIVTVPETVDAFTNLGAEIPHELAHVLIYQAAGGEVGYQNLPTWLNEGLAVMNEASPNAEQTEALVAARQQNTLFSLERLCSNFPPEAQAAQVAYAQSASVVRFIQKSYGSVRLNQLLHAYAERLDCDSGVQRVFGLSLDQLEREWLRATFDTESNPTAFARLTDWAWFAGLIVLGGLIFLILLVTQRIRPVGRMI